MSYECEDGEHRFNCDEPGCKKNVEVDEDHSFREAWLFARQKGWVNSESRGTWQHYCPDHKSDLGDD
jgi:hypothetical protein